jgi:hypothetical protein
MMLLKFVSYEVIKFCEMCHEILGDMTSLRLQDLIQLSFLRHYIITFCEI